jgi:hypothetical protein
MLVNVKCMTVSLLLSFAMPQSKCPNPSCEFVASSSKAHAVHRNRKPECELAHAMEIVRWREIFAENLARNVNFIDAVLPLNCGNVASHESNNMNGGNSPLDRTMEDVQLDTGQCQYFTLIIVIQITS